MADILNAADVYVPIHELRTTRWLMTQLGDVIDASTGATLADQVLLALQTSSHPRVIAAYQSMGNDGIDLSDPQVQSMISVIGSAAGWSEDLIGRLKSAGFERKSKAEVAGLGIVTPEQVETAWRAKQAKDSGDVIYDQNRVLLSVNMKSGRSLMSLQITSLGEFNGVEVEGETRRVYGSAENLAERESALLAAVSRAVSEYLSGV